MRRLLRAAVGAALWPLGGLRARRRPAAPRRVVAIMAGYLGDTFWAAQVLPLLAAAFPGAEVFAVARGGARPLLNGFLPSERVLIVDSIVSDRGRERFRPCAFVRDVMRARALAPDLVFDLMGNPFSALFALGLGAFSVGADLDPRAARLYSFAASSRAFPGPHLALRPRAVARQFLGVADGPVFSLRPPAPGEAPEAVAARLGLRPGAPVLLLVPGAGWAAKRWPAARYRVVAAALQAEGWQVAVAVAPGEMALFVAIAQGAGAGDAAGGEIAVVAVTRVADVVSLLPLCAACVGGDTGLVHVAEAAGVPCVTLYCATNPVFSAGPGPRVVNLAAVCPLAPAPGAQHCGNFPRLECARPACMDIGVEKVLAALRRLTGGGA